MANQFSHNESFGRYNFKKQLKYLTYYKDEMNNKCSKFVNFLTNNVIATL